MKSTIKSDHCEEGLFKALLEHTLKKDLYSWKKCLDFVPQTPKYLSCEIQHDKIEVMASCVRNEVSKDINEADVPFVLHHAW